MDNQDQPTNPDTMITEVLDNYPLEPLPANFVNNVMQQVQAVTTDTLQVRFRLDFMDWIIPVFASLFALLVMAFVHWWSAMGFVPGGADAGLFTAVWQAIDFNWIVIVALVVITEIFIAGVVVVWLWFDDPPTLACSR